MPHNYTDYLGNPVNVGDTIVYPVQQGSSAANLTTGEVLAVEDIVPNDPSDPCCTRGYLHRDQPLNPLREIASRWDPDTRTVVRRDDKAYILRVRRIGLRGNKQVTIKNVDRVVVVTRLLPVQSCSGCGSARGHFAGCLQASSDGGFGLNHG